MLQASLMDLKILLPFQVFTKKTGITRIVAETSSGALGLLPRRLDFVAALVPGILTYEGETGGEVYVAVDQGVMIKIGLSVLVSVRNAIEGVDLSRLREEIKREYLTLDEQEKSVLSITSKLESGLVRRLVEFHHE
jgi:F-type H+-transporting ATPase subunit epsilon